MDIILQHKKNKIEKGLVKMTKIKGEKYKNY